MENALLDLYDPEEKNLIVILNALETSNGKLNIQNLSYYTGYSKPSVSKYILKIIDIINEDGLNNLKLYISDENYIVWSIEDIKEYKKLRNSIVSQCSMIKLGKRLILGEKIIREEFVEENYLTISTFKRRLSILKSEYDKYSINLCSKEGRITLEGPEIMLRYLARNSFMDLYSHGEWPFEEISEVEVETILEIFQNDVIKFLPTDIYHMLKIDIAIQNIRYSRGHTVIFREELKDFFNKFNSIESKRITKKIPNFNYSEVDYFKALLLSKDYFYRTPLGSFVLQELRSTKNILKDLTTFALNELITTFSIKNTEELISYLYSLHVFYLMCPEWKEITYKKENICSQKGIDKDISEIFYKMCMNFPNIFPSDNNNLKIRYVQLVSLFEEDSTDELSILIKITGTNKLLEAELIKKAIIKNFAPLYDIKFVNKNEDLEILIDNYSKNIIFDKNNCILSCYMNSNIEDFDLHLLQRVFFNIYVKKLTITKSKILEC